MKTAGKIVGGIACACIGVGIVVAMVGFSIGRKNGFRNEDFSYSYSGNVENVDSINLDIDFGYVNIVRGEEFSYTVNNVTENGFTSEVEQGTWKIKQDNSDRSFSFFGWNIPISFSWFDEQVDVYPNIVITIPESFTAQKLNLELGAGELVTNELTAENASIDVGAGTIEVRHFNVNDKFSCEVGAGEVVIKDLTTKNADLECGVGSIKMTGEILGDLSAECGMGKIDLDLSGDEDNYNYYVDCGAGKVSINGESFSFADNEKIRNNNAIGTFRLNCSVGSMKVRIN